MNTDTYIALIYKNLRGDITQEEFETLQSVTVTENSYMQLRSEIEEAWDLTGDEATVVSPKETTALLDRVIDSSREDTPKATPKTNAKTISIFRKWAAPIAAIFLLGLAAIWLMQDQTITYDKAGVYTLTDGSIVNLRDESTLTIESFDEGTRAVRLQGEGYFNIKADPDRSFVVNTRQSTISVLGTKFLIKESTDKTYIKLDEGEIRTTNNISQKVENLKANAMVIHSDDGKITSIPVASNLSGWIKGAYRYNDTPLNDVIAELEIIFDKEIKINNEEILRCPISGILVGKTAKEILDKIASEFDFKVNKSSQGWIIEGGQCK